MKRIALWSTFVLLLAAQLVAFQEPQGNATCGREPTDHPCACARTMRCPMNGMPPIEPGDGSVPGEAKCTKFCRTDLCFCCRENCGSTKR